ncbi:MAG: hypothetical protein Tsb0034_10110 [Ekhidna sp.]
MNIRKFLLGFVCFLSVSISNGYAQKDTLSVLFVGNSYTYFWNLPQTVEVISKEQDGVYIKARQSTAGGATWQEHWDGERKLESKKLITEGNWDIVVLQNHSKSTIEKLEQFEVYGERFVELVKKSGAQPVLYQTWAREYNPLTQPIIEKGYQSLAEKHKLKVVPVGNIWIMVRDARPDLKLYDPDGSHPSTIGTYLTACAFYAYLTDKNALGIPHRLKTRDANGETLYLSIMSPENAAFLQTAIDRYREEEER